MIFFKAFFIWFMIAGIACAQPQEKGVSQARDPGFEDRLIGSALKTLAKTYINVSDFDRSKQEHARRIEVMQDDEFRRRYPRMLKFISDSPSLGSKFGIRPGMTARQAAAMLRSYDKKKLSKIIDALDDRVIAFHFREYLYSHSKSVNARTLMDQVNAVWQQLRGRLDNSTAATGSRESVFKKQP